MNNSIRKKLGEKIRQLRKLRGFTQEQLGEKSGLSYKFIGEVERGTVNPSLDSLISIATALDVSINDLFPVRNDFFLEFSHEDLKAIRKAVKILHSRLYIRHAKV